MSTNITNDGVFTLTNKTLTSPKVNVGSDATGDIYYRNASGILTRLPIGTEGQALNVVSGVPLWQDAGGGGGFTSSARAFLGTNTSIGSGAWTKVPLGSESYDIDGEYDPTTNYRFTATDAGRYSVNGSIRYQTGTTAEIDVGIYLNGTLHSVFQGITTAEKRQVAVSDILNLSASDYIELYTRHFTGVANLAQNGTTQTFLSVARIQ